MRKKYKDYKEAIELISLMAKANDLELNFKNVEFSLEGNKLNIIGNN